MPGTTSTYHDQVHHRRGNLNFFFSVRVSLAGLEPVGFRVESDSDLRNHQAIVHPRVYDSLMVTQITLAGPVRFVAQPKSRMTVTVPPPLHGYCDHQENREPVIGCGHLKCTHWQRGITR